jgi:AcrR family transcriptional regulator
MKTTKEEQSKKRKAIIEAFADIAVEKRCLDFSLNSVAKSAGVGSATLYRYFPNKKKLLYGFYSYLMDKIHHEVESVDTSEYTFEEKLQLAVETQLEVFLPYREFIELTFLKTFYSFGLPSKEMYLLKDKYLNMVSPWLKEAIEKDEFQSFPFQSIFMDGLWYLFLGMGAYWLKDDSEDFEKTTEFLDKTLMMGGALLRSNICNHASELGSFVIRNHFHNHFHNHFFKPSFLTKSKKFGGLKNHFGSMFK